MKPCIKYPGSKWRIAKELVKLIPTHHSYVEPYFGSGAVFFNKSQSNIETINDLDDEVINLFNLIRDDPERLANLVNTTPYGRKVYEKAYKNSVDKFEKAVNFIIRCNQGHGFRTTGEKVGWKNDVVGREKAYAVKSWNELPNVIFEVAERLKEAQIESRPAIEVIKRFNHEKVFMYIDPPYVLETRRGKQYKFEMNNADHIELLKAIRESKAKIMISGYESEMYNEFLFDWSRIEFMSNDNTGRRRREIIWINYELDNKLF